MNHTPLPACGHPLPALRGEGRERGDQKRFMATTHVRILEVFPLHEAAPHPFPLPNGGEGGPAIARSGEGASVFIRVHPRFPSFSRIRAD